MQQVTYIMGASGSGKTTRTRELAAAMSGVVVISTDVIRAQLRAVLGRAVYPELWAESFDVPSSGDSGASPGADGGGDGPTGLNVAGFERQCAPVLRAVEAAVAYVLTEGSNCIVEGVHLVPGWFSLPEPRDDLGVAAELRVVRDKLAHRELFSDREADTRGRRPAARYHEMLTNIRAVQELLETKWAAWTPDLPTVTCSLIEVERHQAR